jgi:hypothetical protein
MSEPSSLPPDPTAPDHDAIDLSEPVGAAGSVGPPTGMVGRPVRPLVRLLPPPPEGVILTPPEPREKSPRPWFLVQLWNELRLAVRMYFDPRYRVSRTAQLAFLTFAALLTLNYFLFAVWFSLPVISPVAERVCDVFLAVLAYRVLQRELDRYRNVLDYLDRFAHQQ